MKRFPFLFILFLSRSVFAEDMAPPLPNVLLLLDTSGSMERMIDGSDPHLNLEVKKVETKLDIKETYTFVIGFAVAGDMGSGSGYPPQLDSLAKAGGTEYPYIVDSEKQLKDLEQEISVFNGDEDYEIIVVEF